MFLQFGLLLCEEGTWMQVTLRYHGDLLLRKQDSREFELCTI